MLNNLRVRRHRYLERWLRWRRKCSLVRSGTFMADSVQVLGWDCIDIGRKCVISDDCWLNVNERGSGGVSIRVGDFTFLGRRNFLSSGSIIDIGPYCLTGVDCHFLGADHNYSDPLKPYITTGVSEGGDIKIGANTWLGSRVTILKDVTIGYGSVVGAASLVSRDIPPLSIAVGSPARVIKRFDVTRGEWVQPGDLDGKAEVPQEEEYIRNLRKSFPSLRLPVVAGSVTLGDL
jgi:acetyltransferase-like isoleucine patch superfamily enzyme